MRRPGHRAEGLIDSQNCGIDRSKHRNNPASNFPSAWNVLKREVLTDSDSTIGTVLIDYDGTISTGKFFNSPRRQVSLRLEPETVVNLALLLMRDPLTASEDLLP